MKNEMIMPTETERRSRKYQRRLAFAETLIRVGERIKLNTTKAQEIVERDSIVPLSYKTEQLIQNKDYDKLSRAIVIDHREEEYNSHSSSDILAIELEFDRVLKQAFDDIIRKAEESEKYDDSLIYNSSESK